MDQRVTRTAPIRAANVKKFDEDRMNSMMQSIVKLLQTNSTKQRRISFKAKTKSDVIVDEVARNATVGARGRRCRCGNPGELGRLN